MGYAEGRKVITEAINKIKASPSANDAFVTSLQSDLGTCLTGLRDRSQYVSMGKGYMRQNVKCHKKKRAANFQRSYASQNHYQTKSRSARYEDFSRADSDDSDEEDNINLDPRRARRQRNATAECFSNSHATADRSSSTTAADHPSYATAAN